MKIHKIDIRELKRIIEKFKTTNREVLYLALNDGDYLKIEDKPHKIPFIFKIIERGLNVIVK